MNNQNRLAIDKEPKTPEKIKWIDELTKNTQFNHCCELIAELLIKYKKLEIKKANDPEGQHRIISGQANGD